MRQPVIVIHETDDGLYREKWIFDWHQGSNLMLRRYLQERHELETWRILFFYDREENTSAGPWQTLKESDVPWDDELKAEAVTALVATLKVGRAVDFGV